MRLILAISALLLLSGCVTSVVKEVITAPIKVVSKTADLMTTSQSEADEKRGREMRKREERLGKLARERDKAVRKCDQGDADACQYAQVLDSRIASEQGDGI